MSESTQDVPLFVTQLFEPDRAWLSQQGIMHEGWVAGCQQLVSAMNEWLLDYSNIVCDRPVILCDDEPGRERYLDFLRRLWRCWSYHWKLESLPIQEAGADSVGTESRAKPVDGFLIAAVLRGEQKIPGKNKAGVNLLFEVVLAEGVVRCESKAYQMLSETYKPFAVRMARAADPVFGPELANDTTWWEEIVSQQAWSERATERLQAANQEPEFDAGKEPHQQGETGGSLRKYEGRGALKAWLAKPIHFRLERELKLRRRRGYDGRPVEALIESHSRLPIPDVEKRLMDRFDAAIVDLVKKLPVVDSLLIMLWAVNKFTFEEIQSHFEKGWQEGEDASGEIAKVGTSIGALSRRLKRICERLRIQLLELDPGDAVWAAWVSEIFEIKEREKLKGETDRASPAAVVKLRLGDALLPPGDEGRKSAHE